ncbi:MAG: rifampicin phosphotransferase [Actinomycetota bacterium]|nr:rifampicin phosphotransferase [Actinomycetota bacterium]
MSATAARGGIVERCRDYGLPIDDIEFAAVNGFVFSRTVWCQTDEVEAREHAAAATLAARRWLDDAALWWASGRPAALAANTALASADTHALDERALAAHLEAVREQLIDGGIEHFNLHLADMIPIGLLVGESRRLGIDDAEAVAAMTGASPSSSPSDSICVVADAVRCAGIAPTNLDEIRALDPAVAVALDEHLDRVRFDVVSRYDVDTPTVGEVPAVTLGLVRSLAAAPPRSAAGPDPRSLRGRVSDDLIDDALATYPVRDDNTWVFGVRMGLLRRAILEAARRLGLEPSVALEATAPELASALRGSDPIATDELAQRAEARRAWWGAAPPPTLGRDDEGPGGVGPSSVALLEALGLCSELMEAPVGRGEPLCGVGVGSRSHVGRAVVGRTPDELVDDLEVGDVLVTWTTSPTIDHLLSMAGAVVTVAGGVMSHAAVMARELGMPALLGVHDAIERVRTGDLVEVDPVAGRLTIVG